MFASCECCVLSGRGLCDRLITRPESYRLWCVVVCDLETSWMRRSWPALGRSATGKKGPMGTQKQKHFHSLKIWISPCPITLKTHSKVFFFLWRSGPAWAMVSLLRFLDHTQRRITVGRTPLDAWSARRRDLYLTTHNRQTSMLPVGFKPTISAGEGL